MNHGFVRVAAAVPEVKVGYCRFNIQEIETLMRRAEEADVQMVCFPELAVTGYTCADLFNQQLLLEDAEAQLAALLLRTSRLQVVAMVGMPVQAGGKVFNAAVIIRQGSILGGVLKT